MKNAIAEIYTSEVAIVLIGNFNPSVFQPIWFAHQQLLRSAEVEKANINVIHPDVASFSTDWLSLQITRDRFTALTKSEPHITHLRDFVAGTFAKMQQTPIRQLGINCSRALKFNQDSDFHNFGHFFAPKSPWGKVLKKPGMLEVSVRFPRADAYAGNLNASVEYAGPLAATMKVNDHFDAPLDGSADVESASYFTNLLLGEFSNSINRTVSLTDEILEQFSSVEKFDNGFD